MNLGDLIPVMGLLVGAYGVGFIIGYGIYAIRRAINSTT